jgi:hypothetical protein
MISYSGGYRGERHYRTHLILASLRIVDDLIFRRELEGLLDVLKQVAPRHRHHDVDVMYQKQWLVYKKQINRGLNYENKNS